jgi:hypothetical protein
VVVAVTPDHFDDVVARAEAAGVPVTELGEAGGTRLIADGDFDVSLADATAAWRDAIPTALTSLVH